MKKSSILFCLVCLLFVSCSNFSNNKSVETHFPFKENPRDKWGLVDANGKILVANEFKNQPSTVINGMFFVQQDKGYEMYSVKNPLSPVGEIYKNIAPFTEDIAPAVKEGEGIKYIDKKGHVKFELPIDIVKATNFINGYSRVGRKENGRVHTGICSLSGKMLFFPNFNVQQVLSNGTILASKEDETGGIVYLLDSQGKVKTKLGVERSVCSTDEKYYIYEDGIGMYGISTIDGQKIIKAKYSFLYFTTDGNVIFSDDHERYGIMNTKGEILIKPRYSRINDCQDGLFIASKDGDSFGLLNMKEERIIGFDYSDLFFVPNSKNLYAEKESDNYVYIIDRKNNEIGDYSQFELGEYGNLQSWFSLMFGEYSKYSDVKSDYFDTKDCIMSLLYPSGKTIDNLYGFAGMKPGDCVDKIGVSLSRDDIGNENHWFPYQILEQNEYGEISYSLGFEKVVDTYYDEDDYWEIHPYYTYSDYPCDFLNVTLHMNYETQDHAEQIEKNIEKTVMDLGFSKIGTTSYSFGDYPRYKKSNVIIASILIFDDELCVKVYLEDFNQESSQQNVTNNSPHYVVINGTELRLRVSPSTNADTFKWKDGSNRHPNKGEKYRYLGESGDFYKIDYKGNELWVSKQYTYLE